MSEPYLFEKYAVRVNLATEMKRRGLITKKEYEALLIKIAKSEGLNPCNSPRCQKGSNTTK